MPYIIFKDMRGDRRRWRLYIPNDYKVWMIKGMLSLERYTDIPTGRMKIAYKGRILNPDEQLLEFYNVQDNDEMYVFERWGADDDNPRRRIPSSFERLHKRPKWLENRIYQLFCDRGVESFKCIEEIIWEEDRYRVSPKFVVDFLITKGGLKHVKQHSGIRYLRDMHRGGIESHFPDPDMPEDDDVSEERIQAALFDYGRDHHLYDEVWPMVDPDGEEWENRALNMYDRWVPPTYIMFILGNRLGFNMDHISMIDLLIALVANNRADIFDDASAANGYAVTLRSRIHGRQGLLHPPIVIGTALRPLVEVATREAGLEREELQAERNRRLNRSRPPRSELDLEVQRLYHDGVPITRIPDRITPLLGRPTLREVVEILDHMALIKIRGYPTLTSVRFLDFFHDGEVVLEVGTSAHFNPPYNPAAQGGIVKSIPYLTYEQTETENQAPAAPAAPAAASAPHPPAPRTSASEERAITQMMLDQQQGLVFQNHTPAGLLRMQARGQNIYTQEGLACLREQGYPTLHVGQDRAPTQDPDMQVEVGSQAEELDFRPLDELEDDEDEEMGEAQLHHEMDIEDEHVEENPGDGSWPGRGGRRRGE